MDKKKTGMESIQFWLHCTLKMRLERYGKARGLTMAESLRCLVVNLPDEEEVSRAELIALRDKIQKRIATLPDKEPTPPAERETTGGGGGE